MRMGALGIKIVCAGRLAGSEMARRDKEIVMVRHTAQEWQLIR